VKWPTFFVFTQNSVYLFNSIITGESNMNILLKTLLVCSFLFLDSFGELIRLDTTRQYITDGANYSPGDTICLEPGRRQLQHFKHLHGEPGAPITITNCPEGQVLIGTEHYYGFTFDSVSYVEISGSGSSDYEFGIWVDGTAAGVGVGVGGLSHHVEIHHLRISGINFAGIMVKKDFGGDPPIPYPVFDGLSIHHNWIHDVGGEGMYLGETKSPGMIFKNVDVSYNLLQRTGWDLLQIANMVENINIHHNILLDGGVSQEPLHQNGFQIGDNSGDIRFHHNIIKRVAANHLILMGSGTTTIDSNYFEFTSGDRSLFMDHRSFVDTGAVITIRDNYFHSPQTPEYWRVYNDLNQIRFSGNTLYPGPELIYYASGAGEDNVLLENNSLTAFEPLKFSDSAAGSTEGHNHSNFLVDDENFASMNLGFGNTSSTGLRTTTIHSNDTQANTLWIHPLLEKKFLKNEFSIQKKIDASGKFVPIQ
jgi:hypothetical protein